MRGWIWAVMACVLIFGVGTVQAQEQSPVVAMAWTKDDRWLVTLQLNGTLQLIDPRTKKTYTFDFALFFPTWINTTYHLAVNPVDPTLLAVGSVGRHFWIVQFTGSDFEVKASYDFEYPFGDIQDMAWNADGHFLAFIVENNAMSRNTLIYDTRIQDIVKTYEYIDLKVPLALRWNPVEPNLLLISFFTEYHDDNALFLVDVSHDEILWEWHEPKESGPIYNLAWNLDGTEFVTNEGLVTQTGTIIRIHSRDDGRLLGQVASQINSSDIIWSPGSSIALLGYPSVEIWNPRTLNKVSAFSYDNQEAIAWSYTDDLAIAYQSLNKVDIDILNPDEVSSFYTSGP